jgi:putative DNA primase/helicase
VTDVLTCEPSNLHRTWLARDGRGKAPIDTPRRLLKGHRSRGVIRLWPDSEVTMGLVLGEGIETCLAAALDGLTPVWATMSAGNLANFPVLPGIEGITVLVDHDRPNPKTGKRAGHEAAYQLIQRYTQAGFDPKRDIRVIMPPTEGEDVNDLVRRDRGAA